MVDQIAVVTVTIPATATPFTVDFTSPSITQAFSAAIFIFSRETTDSSDQTGGVIGIGFVSAERGTGATGEQAMSAFAEHGNATAPNTGFSHTNAHSISITDTTLAGTVTLAAEYSSSISGGVRMNISTRTITCKVTAILFAGLSRAVADGCSATTVSATEGVGATEVGQFSPDLVIFAASDTSLSTPPANGVGAHPNIGFAIKSSLAQICAHVSADDATEPSDADGFIKSAAAFGHLSGARAIQTSTITAFPSTGFTHIASAGTIAAHYLALKFSGIVRLGIANFPVAASTGNQTFDGFGFTPALVFGMSTLLTAVDAALEDGARASCSGYFVTGAAASRAITWHTQEGLTIPTPNPTSIAHTRQEDVAVLQYDHTGAVVQRATWVGASGNGGFILNFSTASSSGFLTALGIQLSVELEDTEQISEALSFRRGESSSDTERVTETLAFRSSQPSLETERITEALAFRRGESQGETERILESALLLTSAFETVTGLQSAGAVFEASAVKGETIVALARSGAVWEGTAQAGEVEGGGGGAVAGVVEGG